MHPSEGIEPNRFLMGASTAMWRVIYFSIERMTWLPDRDFNALRAARGRCKQYAEEGIKTKVLDCNGRVKWEN